VLGLFPAASPSSPRPAGLPDSRTQPSGPSLSNHLRMLRLARARYPSAGRTETASPRDISQPELGPSPFPGWLATPRRPNRVQFPPLLGRLLTHWSFTSCCSPPRLATTQLQSVTSYVDLERTSTSPTKRALRRTRAGLQPRRKARPNIFNNLSLGRRCGGAEAPRFRRPGCMLHQSARLDLLSMVETGTDKEVAVKQERAARPVSYRRAGERQRQTPPRRPGFES